MAFRYVEITPYGIVPTRDEITEAQDLVARMYRSFGATSTNLAIDQMRDLRKLLLNEDSSGN